MSPLVKRDPLKTWMRFRASSLVVALLAGLTPCLAQTSPPPPSASPATHHPRAAARSHTSKAAKPSPEPTPPPPAPIMPDWPINDQPKAASITWDSKGLTIDAANSSLRQILSDVATTTGMKVEGMGTDERVYGDYGPGSASDVLSDLLRGTGYNFLLMGQQSPGTPLEIVLSARNTAAPAPAHPAAQNDNSDDSGDSEIDDRLQPEPSPIRPNFAPGAAAPPRTPQQIMEEMQQRQQQMQQQQNPPESNQNNPPNQPNQPN